MEVWIVEYAYYQLCHSPVGLCPFLLSTSICRMDRGGLDPGICLLPTIHTLSYSLIVLLVLCFNLCIMIPSVHMASITPVHPGEGSSSVALLKVSSPFSPWRVVWEFFLIRCEVLGQGCLYLQIVKHSETNLWKWAIQINWIENLIE